MARYIDADLILPHIDEEIAICKEQERVSPSASANRIGLQVARSFIATAPTADVVEVKHGKWIRNERNIPKMREFHEKGIGLSMSEISIFWTCSECGMWGHLIDKYCSECGAKMDGHTPQKINHDSLCETETFKVGGTE